MSRLTTKQRRSRARAGVGEDTGWRVVAVQVDRSGVITLPRGYKGHEVHVSYSYDRRGWAAAPASVTGVTAKVWKAHRRPRPAILFGTGTLYLEGKRVGTVRDVSVTPSPPPRVYGRAWVQPTTLYART